MNIASVTKGIVDSLPQALLEGRPAASSFILTPQQVQQLQQLQRLQAAQEQVGGALTLTLQQTGGVSGSPQLLLTPQGFITTGGGQQPTAEHILHASSQQIGTTSIQHVLQSSISHHHVRQASILQSSLHQIPSAQVLQVGGSELRSTMDKSTGSSPASPFSPRSLTPSPSPTAQHRTVVTPQSQVVVSSQQAHPTVLQFIQHQATTRNSGAIGTLMPSQVIKAKPPQILPKPVGGNSPLTTTNSSAGGKLNNQPSLAQSQTLAQPQGHLLLNQMLPNGAVLVQQHTSNGVQFILKSPQAQHKTGLVLANGGIHQPQAVIVQGRTQAHHQVLRLVPGQMQLQQIQTSSGPTLIAVPAAAGPGPPPPRSSPTPQAPPANVTIAQKKLKKKKKRECERPNQPQRLDLANLIKISGIEDDDVVSAAPASSCTNTDCYATVSIPVKASSPQPRPVTRPASFYQQNCQPQLQQPTKQQNHSQLLGQLQNPMPIGGSYRLSVGEDGMMVVTQADQIAQADVVTPSIAAAAQSQLAQLIADHGGQILQTNTSLSNSTSKETAFMQSLQTAVLQIQGAATEGMVFKGLQNAGAGSVLMNTAGGGGSNVRRAPVVMGPSLQQNGVRLVADLNGTLQQATSSSLTEHNRLIVSSLSPAVLEQNRVQIVTGVPTSTALSLEQQNRLIVSTGTPSTMLTQQGRVLVSTGSLEQHQNRVQIVTSNSSAVSLTEQNRVIVSNVPSNVSLDQQNRIQFMSTGLQNSLMGEQNRVIVSGVQSNLSLSEQNRVQIVSGNQSSGVAVEQNRVIVSGVQSSLTEQQNRLQIVSAAPSSANSLSLAEQNRVHIVSNMPNANILSEKQNLVQIVNSNISLSEEQNRVQIVATVANQTPDRSRLHIVNSISTPSSISLSEQNRVHLVANVPVSNAFTLNNNVQLVTSLPNSVAEQNKIHFSSMAHSNSINVPNHHNQQVHMVTSMPNSTDAAKAISSLSTPSFPPAVEPNQPNKVHFAFKNHSSVPLEQKRSAITNYHPDHSNVQAVSALVNHDKDNFLQLPKQHQHFVKTPELQMYSASVQSKEKELEESGKLLAMAPDQKSVVSLSDCSGRGRGSVVAPGSLSDAVPPRLQYVGNHQDVSKIQVVGANNHHTTVISQGNQVKTSVVYSHEPSRILSKSPGAAAMHITSPVLSPPVVASSSVPSPQATFNNRPNLTVVTGHPRTADVKPELSSMPMVNTTMKSAQTNTPRRTYDNAFLDSIAQAHPSLVINKSPPPPVGKLLKGKKPVKKAALVKPMMAEDRSTNADKDDPPNLVPIDSIGSPPPPTPSASVVPRVQTIQLTPQKQQQLKAIQTQVASLTANKFRSPGEQAMLQRLVSEQRKILLGGKVIPTVPGQHAQGLAFVSASSGSANTSQPLLVNSNQAQQVSRSSEPASPAAASVSTQASTSPQKPLPPLSPSVSAKTPTPSMSFSQPRTGHSTAMTSTTTTAHKATSPIPTQHQVSTQTPQLPPPKPPPIFTRAKRAQLIEQQLQADRQGAIAPDTHTPFTCKADAVKRLIRYHTLNEPVLSEKDLDKADEIFEQTARTLLDRKANLYNKFAVLVLKESMRPKITSELVLLLRLANDVESAWNDQLMKATASSPNTSATAPSASGSHHSSAPGLKREREELYGEGGSAGPSDSVKKHCPDDEEINAQVQSAIDSILNLQRKPPP